MGTAQINADARSQEERQEEESTPEQEGSALFEETPESASSLTQIEDDEIFARELQFELNFHIYRTGSVQEAIARRELELLKESVQAIRNVVEEVKPHAEQVAKNVVEEAKPH